MEPQIPFDFSAESSAEVDAKGVGGPAAVRLNLASTLDQDGGADGMPQPWTGALRGRVSSAAEESDSQNIAGDDFAALLKNLDRKSVV